MPLEAEHFLGKPLTADYVPSAYPGLGFQYMLKMPPFTLMAVNQMLTDSRITFGLWLIKGPILAESRFFVDCDNPQVKEFLVKNITRFWRNSASRALKALEWGYSCSEALYRVEYGGKFNGQIVFDTLKDLYPLDCRTLTRNGKIVGATVRNIPGKKKCILGGPRCLWHVHGRENHPWYGRSRLFGSYMPWLEAWSDGGYRDARRLYFFKYAFDGGIMYHPPGVTKTMDDGNGSSIVVSNKDLAREMLEKKKSGAVLTLPNIDNGAGNRAWEYMPPTISAPPSNVMDYGDSLRKEIFEGMGIPPEVIESDGQGLGSASGRAVPQAAFYATLQEICNWLIADADTQLFRPLVRFNFGHEGTDYEIVPLGLMKAEEQLQEAQDQPRPAQEIMNNPDPDSEPTQAAEQLGIPQ